ncbi:transposase [Kitasatospora xanthocidica]|uniref:transposase n=1 Tax=Kitasatospora xanthocidica TaxID=83382 RepID=UPI0036E4D0B1
MGVSVHALSDTSSCPLAWRLFLPESWDGPQAAERREACRIPEDARHRPTWQLDLEMLDELAGAGPRPAVLPASGWTTSKAVPTSAGTATSPSSAPPTCSSPNSAPSQKPCPGPDLPPGPGPPPTPLRHLDRRLPHMPTTHPMADLRHHITKHY